MMETLTIRQEKIVVIDDAGDGRGFLTEEKKSVELVAVKEDPVIDLLDDDYGFGNCSLPKPMQGLHETGPPPFLKKTFRMVEDPETDKIISWTDSQKSFVVWDHHQLSRSLLPKHFKHNNFSSFIRQLNTYVITNLPQLLPNNREIQANITWVLLELDFSVCMRSYSELGIYSLWVLFVMAFHDLGFGLVASVIL